MPTIYATIGLPGSGKSTHAEQKCADGSGRRANRDDIRHFIYGVYFGPPIDENFVTRVQDEIVATTLGEDLDVWLDDTNLSSRARKHCAALSVKHDVPLVWVDFTTVPVDVCIERDAARERSVGAEVINNMWYQYRRTNND